MNQKMNWPSAILGIVAWICISFMVASCMGVFK